MIMKAFNRLGLGLLFTALFVFSFTAAAFTIPEISFLNHVEPLQNVKFIVTPEDGNEQLVAAFDAAKKSIKVGIFGISSQDIAGSLVTAQKRGVSVTVICDSYCEASPKRLAITNQLRESGVTVYIASSGFSITHWKMFVIDENLAFISTMNFISRHSEMRDMGVFVSNPTIVQEILNVYAADIENSKNSTAITPPLSQPNLVWSPANSADKLVQLINSADQTIEIWIENMGNNSVHAALAKAVQRQVKVRVLTSLCGMGMTGSMAYKNLKQLIATGVTVQGMPYPATTDMPYIHAKTINVDHQMVFMGSENFSNNSLLNSRELGLIFNNQQIQSRMANLYEADWKHSLPIPDIAPETCDSLTPPPTVLP
ncbi:MAG: hypothetical protein H7256_03630 [Bdellovibrio sp.]|nr:hypothetical protein [Bdellovibrio sp.]